MPARNPRGQARPGTSPTACRRSDTGIPNRHRSLQLRLGPFVRARPELVAHDDSGASVPTQQRIVVSRRANGFSLFVVGHGFPKERIRLEAGPGTPLLKLGFSPALAKDS